MGGDDAWVDLHVSTATDRAYLPYAATMLLSLAEACSDLSLTVHVLHDGSLDGKDRQDLRRLLNGASAEAGFIRVDDVWLSQFPSKGPAAGNRISWARLALPASLGEVSRVVYLDADTFVCDSLRELFLLELGGNLLAAAPNIVQPVMRRYVEDLGIGSFREYFNAGVLVMDLDGFRHEGVVDQIIELTAQRGKNFFWFDQDALNVAVGSRTNRLHPRWNVQNSFWTWPDVAGEVLGAQDLAAAKTDPAVLHFEGPAVYKPWHSLCQHPYTDRYRGAMARTPWYRDGIRGLDGYSRMIGSLPTRWQMPVHHRLEAWQESIGKMRRRLPRARRTEA
jgi:lipopolysaccharide biosynthesis glycosyltransferase